VGGRHELGPVICLFGSEVPEPVLAWLKALHELVATLLVVQTRVLRRRGVTTTHVPARRAAAKMKPPPASFGALQTPVPTRRNCGINTADLAHDQRLERRHTTSQGRPAEADVATQGHRFQTFSTVANVLRSSNTTRVSPRPLSRTPPRSRLPTAQTVERAGSTREGWPHRPWRKRHWRGGLDGRSRHDRQHPTSTGMATALRSRTSGLRKRIADRAPALRPDAPRSAIGAVRSGIRRDSIAAYISLSRAATARRRLPVCLWPSHR
jgi:hypothetical protein